MKIKNRRVGGKRSVLTMILAGLISWEGHMAYASENFNTGGQSDLPARKNPSRTKFNTRFLADFNNSVDVSYFEQENGPPPGIYHVGILVNQQRLSTFAVQFINGPQGVVPCFPAEALRQLAVDKTLLPVDWQTTACIQLAELFPGATVDYNYDDEVLDVTIPQIYLIDRPEGFIDPERWDEGVDALSMNYSFSATDIHYRKRSGQAPHHYSLYGSLESTLRLGNWRFHTYDIYHGGSQNQEGLQHQLGYAQRAIGSLLSELSIGDISTSGELFESASLQGVMLRSDDRMHPWTRKGYAPIIRGVANSNAVVTVRQNGNVLREKNVPPGEFRISDIAALGYGGDLEVTITESNGETQRFTVPYSSLPQLLRAGYYRYSLAAGRIRYYARRIKPMLLESSLGYGVNNTVSLYGGAQTAPEIGYTALDGGIALNTALGAFNIELSQSLFNDESEPAQRHSLRNNAQLKMGFARRLTATDTAVNLMTYTFSGKNYYSLNQALQAEYRKDGRDSDGRTGRFSNRIEASISQALPAGWGELDLSGWWENYPVSRGKKRYGSSYFVGYRNGYEKINYSFSVNRIFTGHHRANTIFYLNFAMPFGSADRKRPNFNTMLSYSSEEAKLRTGVSGNHTGEESTSYFNAYFRQSSRTLSSFDLNIGHTGSVLQKGLSYSQGMDYYSGAVALSGGAVLHDDGVNFSPWLSDTMALIKAPGAEGASLMNNRLAKVNSRGYALLNSVMPYEENLVTLDLKGTSATFDLHENGKMVVPTAGALVKVIFAGQSKQSILSRLKQENGKYLPFGTHLYDAGDNVVGIVGQGGITIISLPEENGLLEARWKTDEEKSSCAIKLDNLPHQEKRIQPERVITCFARHKEVG